jgi:hypothetical protein
VDAPGSDDRWRGGTCPLNDGVISRSDGIGSLLQVLRLGGSISEEIDEDEPAISPVLGETEATANGRVVSGGVGGRGIQADEENRRKIAIPDTRQGIAVMAAGGEFRGGKQHGNEKLKITNEKVRRLGMRDGTLHFSFCIGNWFFHEL